VSIAAISPTRGQVLADLVPSRLVRDVVLTLTGTALVVVLGLVAVPLPWTPVPLSLATLGVVLVSASLGPVRGAASMVIYLAVGALGVPWFAQHTEGWNFPSFGYIIGYVLAATAVGFLARRGFDRSVLRTTLLMIIGTGIVYLAGVTWLKVYLQIDLTTALRLGATPFLAGDAIKMVIAAGLLPGAWKLVDRFEKS
jgi:biotin transport system substrate-specific component